MKGEQRISAEYVATMLRYEPDTGWFYWTTDRRLANGGIFARAGDRAGSATTKGYRQIKFRILGEAIPVKEHRLAWFVTYGRWPNGRIDHINCDPSDNRISNLREASQSQNMANRGKPRHSASPYKGITYNRRMQRWQAKIQIAGCRVHLGSFLTAEEARVAYVSTATRFLGPFARFESPGVACPGSAEGQRADGGFSGEATPSARTTSPERDA